MDSNVHTFKARLVTKVSSKHMVLIMMKNFSLAAMLKSIKIFLAIVAYYDYEIWKMDVKMVRLCALVHRSPQVI